MGGITVTIRNWWENADRNQRAVTLGGAGLLCLLLLGTFLFASRPHYALLFSGMDEAERGGVVDAIQTMGIPVNYSTPGEVEVPADKVSEVKMKLATSGKLPKNAHLGIADLDKINMMITPAQEKMRLQAAAEGELDRTIEVMDGVQSAQVHIAPGDDSPFVGSHRPATASVTIVEAGNANLTPTQGLAIATLVQKSIPGLDMQFVTVMNQHAQILFNGSDQNSEKNDVSLRFEEEEAEGKKRAREIQNVLDTAFGTGATLVTVHAELDLDTLKTETTDTTPTDPINVEKHKETMAGNVKAPGGIAGQAGNTGAPATKDNGAGSGQTYTNQTDTINRGTSTKVQSAEKMPGTVKSLVINVVADSAKIADNRQPLLRSIIDGEVKNHAAETTTYATNVTFVPFDTSAAKESAKADSAAAANARNQQIISLLPMGALVLIAIMVMKQVGKFTKSQTALVQLHEGHAAGLTMDSIEGSTGPASAANILAAIEGLTGTGLAHADGHGGHLAEALDVEDIKDRVHMPLEQLKKMAHERPGMVALLIKSLLLEDRR